MATTGNPFSPPAWLSIRDLAELLGWTEKKCWNARFRGILPPGRKIVGVGLRFSRASIDAWLSTGDINPTPRRSGSRYKPASVYNPQPPLKEIMTKTITTQVTVDGADEAQQIAQSIADKVNALAAEIAQTPIQVVCWCFGGDAATRAFGKAAMEEVQENIRAPLSAALINLAGVCARHGSWDSANDLLLDASEEAFAGAVVHHDQYTLNSPVTL